MPVIFVLDIFRQFLGTIAYSLGVTNAVPMLKGVAQGVYHGRQQGTTKALGYEAYNDQVAEELAKVIIATYSARS